MSFLRSRRGLTSAAVALILVLFLVRPGANQLRARIVSSISLALGRPVDVSAVQLRLLPRPGFDLENFVVHEDPAFGAEPMLRAQEVTAVLRVSSLLRGTSGDCSPQPDRAQSEPGAQFDGHWNLENLLERAAKIPVAPTSKSKTEIRPGFPYIEADHGRINFKFGQEKKPYALTEADFSIWQDSENAWGMRLKAQPVRTDFNLSDTGTIRGDGSWQRAQTLRETPVQFSMPWDRAQLGQVTKLAYGNDQGWRGGLKISTSLTGTPANLAIATTASVQDFRRYDIFGGGELRLAAQCSGQYSSLDHVLSKLACNAPVADGAITVEGNIRYPLSSRDYDLAVTARELPIQSLIAFARHTKQSIPDDLVTPGRVTANLKFRRTPGAGLDVAWEGSGETSGFRLVSKFTRTELVLGRVPFVLASAPDQRPRAKVRELVSSPPEAHVDIGPFNLPLGRTAPATVRGWASHSGYSFSVQGDAQLQHLLQLARTVGIPASQPTADGIAKVDLQIAGAWSGFAAPRAMGKAQLHSVRAEVQGLNAPLEIASANLLLAPDRVDVENLIVSISDTSWRGSLTLPRQCAAPASCPVRFDLHANELATDRLNQLVNPYVPTPPWYHFLSSPTTGVPYLLTVHAIGKVSANRVVVRKLVAGRVSANAELIAGMLRLQDLRGEVLGGKHVGEWQADFTAKPPEYSGTGTLERVALDQLANTMNDDWITGSASATYEVSTSGLETSDLFASATGTLNIKAQNGVLRHLALAEGSGPLQMHRLAARLFLHDGQFEIQGGKLETPAETYQVSGTASLTRILNLKLTRQGAPGYNITGTLLEPHVSTILSPETRAALKP